VPVLEAVPDQVVFVGEPVLLSAQAEGLLPIHFQWRLAGTNLPNATGSSLQISAAQLGDAGAYQLIATNSAGASSVEIRLTVLEPPTILTDPVSQTTTPGNSIVLSVLASGSPPPIYQWRLNGANIPGAVFSTLTLNNAQPGRRPLSGRGGQQRGRVNQCGGHDSSRKPCTSILK
jgi:hypothetical protein